MFTGIIEELGRVVAVERRGGQTRLAISALQVSASLELGDSVAVSGACLTVAQVGDGRFSVALTRETIERTTLGQLKPGTQVNLELALSLGDRLGGHLMAGHVDGVGEIANLRREGDTARLEVSYPPGLSAYLTPRGSVAVDGVSLTVVELGTEQFSVALVEHTLQHTTLGSMQQGDRVNLEADLIARYLERLLTVRQQSESKGRWTAEELQERGY